MANKPLNKNQIQEILDKQKSAHTVKWPSVEDLRSLAKAVKAEKDEVVFSGGRKFTIRDKPAWDAVFITPEDGSFAPCGYFNRDKLKEALK